MSDPLDLSSAALASTPAPPYYAAIFTRVRSNAHHQRYSEVAARMVELAQGQPGFLGVESAAQADGLGITVSYWQSLEALHAWGRQAEHRLAQREGQTKFYEEYALRIVRVEEARSFAALSPDGGARPGDASGPG